MSWGSLARVSAALAGSAALFFLLRGVGEPVLVGAYASAVGVGVAVFVGVVGQGQLAERFAPRAGGDRLLVFAAYGLTLAHYGLAALERWGVIGGLSWWMLARWVGLGVFVLGVGLAVWALVVNPYSSSAVRVQTERGHRLVTAGPYGWVRHPAYSGYLLALAGSPVALGVVWGALPTAVYCVLIVRRTMIEERLLRGALDGYGAYCGRVRWWFVPGVV